MSIRYIGLDFETSGTDPWGDAVPIQLGIAMDFGPPVGVDFDTWDIGGWDWREVTWSEKSFEIHGISKERLERARSIQHVDILAAADLIRAGFQKARMWNVTVGWNVAGFDRQFVSRWMPNLNSLLSYRTLDLNAVVFAKAGQDERRFLSLKNAAKAYAAEELGREEWHDAGYDALAALLSLEWLRRVE